MNFTILPKQPEKLIRITKVQNDKEKNNVYVRKMCYSSKTAVLNIKFVKGCLPFCYHDTAYNDLYYYAPTSIGCFQNDFNF